MPEEPVDERPETPPGDSYSQRLLYAQRAMPDPGKTGKNTHQSYDYLEDSVLMQHARPILHAYNLAVEAEMVGYERDPSTNRTIVEWAFEVTVPDLGAGRQYKWFSVGWDKGDKDFSKAVTMARKDFIRFLLQVPGGEEAENDEAAPTVDKSTPKQSTASSGDVEIVVHNGLEIGESGRGALKNMGFRYDSDDSVWTVQTSESAAGNFEEQLDEIGAAYETKNEQVDA